MFEFVESFTCTNGAASVSAIDLVVNNALVALQRSGDHEFGVKDMTVYGDHSTSMDAEEVIDFFLERDVALNATATAGEGVKITGVNEQLYGWRNGGIYLEDGEILRSCERNGERRSDYSFRAGNIRTHCPKMRLPSTSK